MRMKGAKGPAVACDDVFWEEERVIFHAKSLGSVQSVLLSQLRIWTAWFEKTTVV